VADGSEVWLYSQAAWFNSSMGGAGPRATPTIADGRVYTVGGTGLFNCLDGGTGKPIWSVDIIADNNGHPIEHGVCCSPLVIGDRVIVCPTGNKGALLAAYDRATGKRLWQTGNHAASYSSPMLVELCGVPQIVLLSTWGAESHAPNTGEFLWSFPFTTEYNQNTTQPVVVDAAAGRVLLSAGYNVGSRLIEVRNESDGRWSTQEIWRSREMKTKFTSAVFREGMAYGLDEGILACIDVSNGKRLWKSGRYQHGQVLLANDLLIVQAEDGDVALVRARPEKLVELARIPALAGKTWNNPTLAGRFLLVRNDHEAACFELPLCNP
jgi:outer membrane protein assembly factor BamB